MDLDTWPNLVAMLFGQAERLGEAPFLWEKREGAYRPTSWRETAAQVSALARALKAYGLKPGERVVLVSENAPHWAIADFAIMAAGGITVPAYTTNTARDHAHILADSGAAMAVVSTATLAKPLLEAGAGTKSLRRVIAIEPPPPSRAAVSLWREALAEGATFSGDPATDVAAIPSDSLACIIYTSGTGGVPKGVMLSHRAILANCVGARDLLVELGLGEEVFLSFLPLSHAYEHSCGLMFPISIGAQIYYAEGVETLAANLLEARPTLMTAVPRLYEVMRTRILHGVRRAGGLKARLFWRAVEIGRKRYEGGALGLGERVLDLLLERLVRDKVRARFGGRLKALISGGAPLAYEVGVFFTALGLRLLQGYGQTEAAPVISCNPARLVKLRTVGPPITGTEVKIADDGEILVRGPLLMDGYWNQKRASAEALRGGWLHTGDVGVIDHDGYVQITDRKKDIIVNSAGENVSPQRVEGALVLEPEIEQAMVIGDGRPHLVALVVPSEAFVAEWARAHGTQADLAALSREEAFHDALQVAVERANMRLSVIEKVRRFAIAMPFTIENATMTPTMKVRRHEILKRYGATLEALY